ncbi:MAG: hypothetical protein JWP77_895, partial [Polaromonas sp.]|nr:hypothetical protein [Polaromonas sp.]
DGPNVETSPWELDAAQGHLPLEGARADETEPGQDPASGPQAG